MPWGAAILELRSSLRSGARSPLAARLFVGADDVLHDPVADDVARREMDEVEALDPGQDLVEADQSAAAAWHVDLGDVAGDHCPGAEADAGEEHLHLLGRRVLGLVEDDEAV